MKKLSFYVVILLAFLCFSCGSGPRITGEVTQEKIDGAFHQIYETYRSSLDTTGAQSYTVAEGDTLSGISRKVYGDLTGVGNAGVSNGFYFPVIMLASNTEIVDPDLISPGTTLTIVDLKKNLDNSNSRRAIKSCLNEVAYIYNKKGQKPTEEGLKQLANSL